MKLWSRGGLPKIVLLLIQPRSADRVWAQVPLELTRAAPVPTPGLLSAAGSRVGPRRGVGSGRGGRVLRLSSHGSRRRLKVSKTLSRWRLFSRGLGRAYRHRRGSGTGWGCRRRRRRSEASAPAAVLSASSQITRLGDRSGREATGYPARPKV
eukprot:1193360-Prorocentrum_minimum.AAC.1